jgi:hypothetical protein
LTAASLTNAIWLIILGAILAISGGFAEKARRRKNGKVCAPPSCKIQAILAIVERRDYIAGLSKFIEAIKGGETGLVSDTH